MTQRAPVVCRLGVDNTPFDNDGIGADLKRPHTRAFRAERLERYREIFEKPRAEFGHRGEK
jgi:hypothetical protein